MGIIDKLQHKLFGTNAKTEPIKPYAPTNTEIVDHIYAVFERVVAHRSVDDDIYFDTVFVTQLPTTVADDVITMAPALATTIVKRFYRMLRTLRGQGKHIMPVANYWQFAFVPADPMDAEAQRQIQVFSFITDARHEGGDLIAQAEMGQVSINGEHSMNTNINSLLLRHVDVIERGKVRLLISPTLEVEGSTPMATPTMAPPTPPVAQAMAPAQHHSAEAWSGHYAPPTPATPPPTTPVMGEPLAEITFLMDGKQMVYRMRRPYLIVGRGTAGDKATPDRLPIVTSEVALQSEHFHIRYDAGSRSFSVAALSVATLGDRQLPISPSVDQLIWTPLRQECALVFGLGHIGFKALC